MCAAWQRAAFFVLPALRAANVPPGYLVIETWDWLGHSLPRERGPTVAQQWPTVSLAGVTEVPRTSRQGRGTVPLRPDDRTVHVHLEDVRPECSVLGANDSRIDHSEAPPKRRVQRGVGSSQSISAIEVPHRTDTCFARTQEAFRNYSTGRARFPLYTPRTATRL